MSKIDFHSPKLSTEDDLKSIASYAERKDFVRSHFDKNYTGTTKENETLLRNPEFKKAYLEKFAHIRSESQDEREKLLKDRPEKNSYIQNVREGFFSRLSQALQEIFRGGQRPLHSLEKRLAAGRDSTRAYSGKPVQQFNSVKLTGYYPGGYINTEEARMEGGSKDKIGRPLYTLQQYLRGEVPYVSIAGHKSIPYGTRVRIAALEAQYGRPIECRIVDTGRAFNRYPPYKKLDVCVQDKQSSHMSIVNTHTPVQQIA